MCKHCINAQNLEFIIRYIFLHASVSFTKRRCIIISKKKSLKKPCGFFKVYISLYNFLLCNTLLVLLAVMLAFEPCDCVFV